MNPVKYIIAGAGSRGFSYARYAKEFPEQAKIVGVAEPREFYRNLMAKEHNIPAENVFTDWRQMADKPKFADAVIISTQDAMHRDPAIAFAQKGYNMLLEKPMAPTAQDCCDIVDAVVKADIVFGVCHVLRYTAYTRKLKEIVNSGVIGDIVTMQHLEPVGWWHQAHSFVRGNWGNEARSAFMLLAKSCHDLDWIRYFMNCRCTKVSSFGNLFHFRSENAPPNAADRCLDCPAEPECPYSAKKIYLGRIDKGDTGWPTEILTPDTTIEGVTKALREGPYGQCVYKVDNDVVDHQVVNMLFEHGQTCTFTMTAFNFPTDRRTSIFGTHGEIYGDGNEIKIHKFIDESVEVVEANANADGSILSGHGGGDFGLMKAFNNAVTNNDRSMVLSGPQETLESHLMVFAAEQARRQSAVIDMSEFKN
ncbi:MAG: Gfo/Idh/MocA family oxidoreductase [Sedimentisphaerales bacterium]|nr:Gfo/Idh/MocA family oxidoreductase [Sedimentisphaerales bacterium]